MKQLFILISAFLCLSASARSYDERIADAMNNSDWFRLDSLYNAYPKDSINPFLEVYSRCLLGNRLNRTDVSINAFQELFNNYSSALDLNNLISSTYMFGMDLSRAGHNETAASLTNSVIQSAKQYLDSATIVGLTAAANRYAQLANYDPYQIEFLKSSSARIPFKIVPVGPAKKGSLLMHLEESTINGTVADITFDTGAGANMIAPELAEKFGLIPLEGTRITVKGVKSQDGYIAIAKELKLGDLTVRDVPFTVLPMSSGNVEADQYVGSFNIVVGSELMLQLKNVEIDFINRSINIPAQSPERTGAAPNLCFSSTMNIMAKGIVLDSPMLMCLDSGNSSYGSLGGDFLPRNEAYVRSHSRLDTVREAGVGGVIESICYQVSGLPVSLAGYTVEPAELTVKDSSSAIIGEYDCVLGLKTLMMFGKLRFNLVDFVLSVDNPASLTSNSVPSLQVPKFNIPVPRGMSVIEAAGCVGLALARAAVYGPSAM